jgi:hypothetical protein
MPLALLLLDFASVMLTIAPASLARVVGRQTLGLTMLRDQSGEQTKRDLYIGVRFPRAAKRVRLVLEGVVR